MELSENARNLRYSRVTTALVQIRREHVLPPKAHTGMNAKLSGVRSQVNETRPGACALLQILLLLLLFLFP